MTWLDGSVYDGEWKDGEAAQPSVAKLAQQDPAPAVNKQPPDHFCDMSFSMELMVDPVMAAYGFTYERASIEKWLVNHNTSPTTGAELEHKKLIPNHSLRKAIQEWRPEFGGSGRKRRSKKQRSNRKKTSRS
jgi:hypothetical protein